MRGFARLLGEKPDAWDERAQRFTAMCESGTATEQQIEKLLKQPELIDIADRVLQTLDRGCQGRPSAVDVYLGPEGHCRLQWHYEEQG